MNMNALQRESLEKLSTALSAATAFGALDILLGNCESPDSINDVCDALESTIE